MQRGGQRGRGEPGHMERLVEQTDGGASGEHHDEDREHEDGPGNGAAGPRGAVPQAAVDDVVETPSGQEGQAEEVDDGEPAEIGLVEAGDPTGDTEERL